MSAIYSTTRFSCRLNRLAIAMLVSTPVLLPVMGHAAEGAQTESALPHTTLDTIVVTATKSPTASNNVIAQTQVIDEDALQRYRGQSALDVLKNQAGINFYESGGQGGLSNFWLRGFSGKQVLVLIDGIRYGSTTTGVPALNLLPADQIDRIEILYGASGSSLYGADAMGGVIQIFSKGQIASTTNATITVGAGSENSYKAQATGQYVGTGTTLSVSAGYEQTDGINATLPSTSPYSDYHPDKDGFKSDNVSIVAKQRFSSDDKTRHTDIGMTGLFAKSTSDYDSGATFGDTYSDQKNGAVTTFINYQQDKLNANVKYGESIDNTTSYDAFASYDNLPFTEYNTRQRQANVQLDYQLGFGKIMGGAEWLKQSLDTNKPDYKVKNRTVNSGFLGYQLNRPTYDAQANVRVDDNSQFGNHTTYNLGLAYRFLPSTRVGIGYSTGFRAPTFQELYYPQFSNPNLKPEESKNSEVFIENRTKAQTTRLTGFYSDVDNIIASNAEYIPFNLSKARIKGATLTSDWQQGKVIFGGNYTYQTTENRQGVDAGKELSYHPNHTGLVYVGYRTPQFDIRTELQQVGDKFSDSANTKVIDGYTLLSVSGNYYISPRLSINTRVNNLTNETYQTIEGYNQKGINSFVSLTYEWF